MCRTRCSTWSRKSSRARSIHLLGMLTEAIHTPLLQDRLLAHRAAPSTSSTRPRHLGDEIEFKPDGTIERRATRGARGSIANAGDIADIGLIAGHRRGLFADINAGSDGGKGLDGVMQGRRTTSIRSKTLLARRLAESAVKAGTHTRQTLRRHAERRHGAALLHAAASRTAWRRRSRAAVGGKMGLARAAGRHSRRPRQGFTFFVVYGEHPRGRSIPHIHRRQGRSAAMMKNARSTSSSGKIGRKVVVVGACTAPTRTRSASTPS